MKANAADFRHRMRDIMRALDRNESVTILYRGKETGILTPIPQGEKKSVVDHPFFGMRSNETEPVGEVMRRIRGARS